MQPGTARLRSQRYLVLGLLTATYTFNFIDRQILGILSPYIQKTLLISDAQIGLLIGFYFALFYTVAGIPIAWLADRSHRVNIIAVSLAIWSGFTALSGAVSNYMQLMLCRIGVGIGEAGGTPPAHALITDYFPATERSRALSIYSLGIPIGITVAYIASAFLLSVQHLDWRSVFYAVGVPGILLALVLKLFISEPRRIAHHPPPSHRQSRHALSQLMRNPAYWGMCLGLACASFSGYAIAAFTVLFFRRNHPDLSMVDLLIWLGVIHGIAYGLGTYFGGHITDRWRLKNRAASAFTAMGGVICGVPCWLAALWVGNTYVALMCMAAYLIAAGTYLGPSFTTAQTLASPPVRATSTAILFFAINMIGLGGGPSLVGYVSTALQESYDPALALRLAMSTLIFSSVAAILCYGYAARCLSRVDCHK